MNTMDFETYSEADLPKVGALQYSLHPSTEVLSLAYDIGNGAQLWVPCLPPPQDLFDYLAQGGVIASWNCSFEHHIWNNVCHARMGWPYLDPRQQFDTMAQARAYCLPGSLDKAGAVLALDVQKDKEGKRLLKKFSLPRKPTKKDPRTRIHPDDDPVDAAALYRYNIRDIEAEEAIGSAIPPLLPEEEEFWRNTHVSNTRGVGCDIEAVRNAIAILEQAYEKYGQELSELTGGIAFTEVSKLLAWVQSQGVQMDNMDDGAITTALNWPIPPHVRRVLEIRQLIGSAGVKKLYMMEQRASPENRLCDLFIYHGARTGRDTGADVQPQNLVKAGPKVQWCGACEKPYGLHHTESCPHCGGSVALFSQGKADWSWEAVDHAVEAMATRSLDWVEWVFGDAILTISGCVRGMLVARDGFDLICSDYSAIEAVVLAALAGEEWRLETFRNKIDIYLASASQITGRSLEEYAQYAKDTGQKHPDRQKIGKVAELACVTEDTKVLTQRGYLGILEVTKTDLLWDGEQWVTHQGVIYKGKREVKKLDGVQITPDHLVNIKGFWKPVSELVSNPHLLLSALETASGSLPSLPHEKVKKYWFNARAVRNHIESMWTTSEKEEAHGVIPVLKSKPPHIEKCITHTNGLCKIMNTVGGLLTDSRRLFQDAIILKIGGIRLTGYEESPFSKNGGKTERSSCCTFKLWTGGTTLLLKWIEWILIKGTNRETYALLLAKSIQKINEAFTILKPKSETLKPVYDIVNAGANNRFTIKTNTGHLIIHNCGYGGWVSAWRNFDSTDTYTDTQVKEKLMGWRAASPAIVEFWGGQTRSKPWEAGEFQPYGLEGIVVQAIMLPGRRFTYRQISASVDSTRDILLIHLPSGRDLTYHRPRINPNPKNQTTLSISYEGWNSNAMMGPVGWIRINTYAGRLTENVVQAVSRDIMRDAVNRLERAGYPVVLRIHDEIVSEVPKGFGSIEEFERLMAELPDWAKDWPVRASGGWRGRRYRKD